MKRPVTTGEAAKSIGVAVSTLQRWASQNLVREAWWRTPGGRLKWDLDKLRELLGIEQPSEPVHDPSAPVRPAITAAIVTSQEGVLIERRYDGRPLWTFPAGEVEPGEAPADTAVREVKEECGLAVKVSHTIGERQHPQTGRHMFYLACRPYHGTAVHVGDEAELAEVRWANLAEAEQLLPDMFGPVHDHLTRVLRPADRRKSA